MKETASGGEGVRLTTAAFFVVVVVVVLQISDVRIYQDGKGKLLGWRHEC